MEEVGNKIVSSDLSIKMKHLQISFIPDLFTAE